MRKNGVKERRASVARPALGEPPVGGPPGPAEPFTAPATDGIDRPPQTRAPGLSQRSGTRWHTHPMTAGTTTTPGTTTAEHELAALQREHGRPLFALLLRLCDGDRQNAPRTWCRRPSYAPGSIRRRCAPTSTPYVPGCSPWAGGSRSMRGGPAGASAEVGDAVLESARVCADHAERSAATLDVREAVKTLTPEHREVLVLVYFQGASVAEAASPRNSARYGEVSRVLRAARPAPGASGIRSRPAVKPRVESNLRKAPC